MFPKQIKEHLPHVSIHTISGINRIRKLGPVGQIAKIHESTDLIVAAAASSVMRQIGPGCTVVVVAQAEGERPYCSNRGSATGSIRLAAWALGRMKMDNPAPKPKPKAKVRPWEQPKPRVRVFAHLRPLKAKGDPLSDEIRKKSWDSRKCPYCPKHMKTLKLLARHIARHEAAKKKTAAPKS
jgi:endogenous inhibitor of DNA gyrase (YacG/DUF329 family)